MVEVAIPNAVLSNLLQTRKGTKTWNNDGLTITKP